MDLIERYQNALVFDIEDEETIIVKDIEDADPMGIHMIASITLSVVEN